MPISPAAHYNVMALQELPITTASTLHQNQQTCSRSEIVLVLSFSSIPAAFLWKSIKFQVTSWIERNPTLTAVCITNLTSRVSVLLSSLILDNLSIPIEGLI